MKAVIGITPDYSYETEQYILKDTYVKAVRKAGGLPVMLFPDEVLPPFLNGVLFTGGGDIDPLLFGEEPLSESGEISPIRDDFEFSLCRQALERKMPMLGVCRGIQVMNIVTGGGIYQDIFVQTGTNLKHMQQAPRFYGTHSITLEKDSLLGRLWKKEKINVNSLHHQSVSQTGKGFRVSARSADGLTEAIEHTEISFAVGVQWHPEALASEEQALLFQAFLKAAEAYKG